jgi:hypothetical protein
MVVMFVTDDAMETPALLPYVSRRLRSVRCAVIPKRRHYLCYYEFLPLLYKVEEHCLLECLHGGINDRYLLGLFTVYLTFNVGEDG